MLPRKRDAGFGVSSRVFFILTRIATHHHPSAELAANVEIAEIPFRGSFFRTRGRILKKVPRTA